MDYQVTFSIESALPADDLAGEIDTALQNWLRSTKGIEGQELAVVVEERR
jgi:hypothetical protein